MNVWTELIIYTSLMEKGFEGFPKVYFLDHMNKVFEYNVVSSNGKDGKMATVLAMDLRGPSLDDIQRYCEEHRIGPNNYMAVGW